VPGVAPPRVVGTLLLRGSAVQVGQRCREVKALLRNKLAPEPPSAATRQMPTSFALRLDRSHGRALA
jgi:hypothetical protein